MPQSSKSNLQADTWPENQLLLESLGWRFWHTLRYYPETIIEGQVTTATTINGVAVKHPGAPLHIIVRNAPGLGPDDGTYAECVIGMGPPMTLAEAWEPVWESASQQLVDACALAATAPTWRGAQTFGPTFSGQRRITTPWYEPANTEAIIRRTYALVP